MRRFVFGLAVGLLGLSWGLASFDVAYARTGQDTDPLLTYCQSVASEKNNAACLNEESLKQARNVASHHCDQNKTKETKASCVKKLAQSYFKEAASKKPKDAKAFTAALGKVLASKGGSKDKPATGFAGTVAAAPNAGGASTGPAPVTGSAVEACTAARPFGLVPWWQYLGKELDRSAENKCDIKCFNIAPVTSPNECGQKGSDIPLVLLAVIDNLLRIAGLVAVAYIIYGAFRYVTSQGSPEQTAKAQNTILNALVGLAIAVVSVGFVSFLGHKLGA